MPRATIAGRRRAASPSEGFVLRPSYSELLLKRFAYCQSPAKDVRYGLGISLFVAQAPRYFHRSAPTGWASRPEIRYRPGCRGLARKGGILWKARPELRMRSTRLRPRGACNPRPLLPAERPFGPRS